MNETIKANESVWSREAIFKKDESNRSVPEGCIRGIFGLVNGQAFFIEIDRHPDPDQSAKDAFGYIGDKSVPVNIQQDRIIGFPTLRSPG